MVAVLEKTCQDGVFPNLPFRGLPGVADTPSMARLLKHRLGERTRALCWGAAVWLAFAVGFAVHVAVRGQVDNFGVQPVSPEGLESLAFQGIPSVWMQRWLPVDAPWLVWPAVVLHASWFYGPIFLGAIIQWRCGTNALFQTCALLLALLFSADVVFLLFPTEPPWMAFDVERVVNVVYGDSTSVDKNPVAALPSLHVAVPALLTITFARARDVLLRRLTPLLVAWTVGITWSVVYGGEHYLVDALAGALLAGFVYALFERARSISQRWSVAARTTNPLPASR